MAADEGIKNFDDHLQRSMERQVSAALAEDIGSGDITAALIPAEHRALAGVLCREAAVICGIPWFEQCFKQFDPSVRLTWLTQEGADVTSGTLICQIEGPARSLLTVERTALNFLQTLSGTATLTRRYVRQIAHTQAVLLDTRKTLPGWRLAQKYATKIAGAHNHRLGLYDAFLIKENHIAASGGIAPAVTRAKLMYPQKKVEVEAETLDQLEQAITAGADTVLLDNFDVAGLRRAVALNAGRVQLEASGGITLDNIGSFAATGVDAISVGAITKNIFAVDLSMRFKQN